MQVRIIEDPDEEQEEGEALQEKEKKFGSTSSTSRI